MKKPLSGLWRVKCPLCLAAPGEVCTFSDPNGEPKAYPGVHWLREKVWMTSPLIGGTDGI